MTPSLTPIDDESSMATDTLETLDANNAAIELAAHWNGPRCEKCEAPMKSDAVAICRRCGWYARLNQFVDVDKDWEAYDDEAEQPVEAPKPSHVEIWLNLLPRWAWIVIATVAAVVVESVVIRLVTPDGSTFRTVWSLTQLVVGLLAFAVCHLFTFLFAVADDADTGALDIILKPLKLWMKSIVKLPTRLWVTDTAAAGLTAVFMSIVVIGGLPYERLWDWGFEQPADQNLMGAVMSQVQKVEGKGGADNLEDAVGDFAGTQNLDAAQVQIAPPPKPRHEADCVILGYRLDAEGRVQSLVLGTAYRKNLVYACSVSPELSTDESAGLLQMLTDIPAKQPYVNLQISAFWVVPKYSCRVSFAEQEKKTGRLLDPVWEEFRGELR